MILIVTLFCAALSAQDVAPPANSTGPKMVGEFRFLNRLAGGGRISIKTQDMVETGTKTLSYTKLEYDYTMKSRAARLGAGATLEMRLTSKIWLSADLLFNRFGYLTTTDIYTGTPPEEGQTDSRKKITTTEKTRATFWDLPVLAHYNVLQNRQGTNKLFGTLGVNIRRVSAIRTAWETSDTNAVVCCNADPARPSHSLAKGFTGGIGVRIIDDFNIKMTPEVRYTRWAQDTFSGVPAQSRKGQLEVVLGFTF